MLSLRPLVFSGAFLWLCVFPAAAEKPNVLFIILDDMNGFATREFDAYPPIQTPYLDKFATESVNFVNAVCPVPVCNPSRAAFLSGMEAWRNGAYLNGADVWNKPGSLNSQIQSLPEYFAFHGYTSWGAGKVFHARLFPEQEQRAFVNAPYPQGGFGPFPDPKIVEQFGSRFHAIQEWTRPDSDFPDVRNADAAIKFLNEDHKKPFFLVYGLWRPHTPYTAPKRFFDLYEGVTMPLPAGYATNDLDDIPPEGLFMTDYHDNFTREDGSLDVDLWREFLRAYCANTTFADWNLGRVIEALDASAHADNTIVIICSDNGFHCGRKDKWEKGTLWESAAHVPLLVRTPGGAVGESTATVSLIDIYPTLSDYCDLPTPGHPLDGQSFVPQLSDPKAAWDRPALTIYGKGNATLRDQRFRYIRYHDGEEELYDHAIDPHEFNNIAHRPEYADQIERLRAHLPKEWAPSWGGRWERQRPGEPRRYAPDPAYNLPEDYVPQSKT